MNKETIKNIIAIVIIVELVIVGILLFQENQKIEQENKELAQENQEFRNSTINYLLQKEKYNEELETLEDEMISVNNLSECIDLVNTTIRYDVVRFKSYNLTRNYFVNNFKEDNCLGNITSYDKTLNDIINITSNLRSLSKKWCYGYFEDNSEWGEDEENSHQFYKEEYEKLEPLLQEEKHKLITSC